MSGEMAIPCENPQEKVVNQLRTLVAAGIDSHMRLMLILVQRCAHGGTGRPHSLTLKRVSPRHWSYAGPCTWFVNNRLRKEQQLADAHTDAGESVHNTAPCRSNVGRIHSASNRTTAARQAARIAAPACATRARAFFGN